MVYRNMSNDMLTEIAKNEVEMFHLVEILFSTWDLSTASYDSVIHDVTSEDVTPWSVFFKSDGTKMYVVGDQNNSIYQYSLTTAWDLSTASYDSVSLSVASEDVSPFGIFFKSDGTKMYIVGVNSGSVYQYTLTTAWDLSTASYDTVSLDVSGEGGAPYCTFFKSDGTKMYILRNSNDSVSQYSLTTAWDLSTASYDSVFHSVASEDTQPYGFFFKSDGTKMYVCGRDNNLIYQYTLTTAWDLSTASYDSVSFSVASESTTPCGFYMRNSGDKLYVVGSGADRIYQYSLSNGSYYTDYDRDLSWNGNTYVSDGNLIQISKTSENILSTVDNITIALSSVALANVSTALTEDFTNTDVRLYRGFLSSGSIISDPLEIFKGFIDSWSVNENPDTGKSVINWEVANYWVKWEQTGGRRTNNSDQSKFFPGDTGFSFTKESIREIKWGRA